MYVKNFIRSPILLLLKIPFILISIFFPISTEYQAPSRYNGILHLSCLEAKALQPDITSSPTSRISLKPCIPPNSRRILGILSRNLKKENYRIINLNYPFFAEMKKKICLIRRAYVKENLEILVLEINGN